ncbi:hypothetical protein O181_038401 [Austropuccinia psidii MF-1]|uniref:Uncharacterized protein n=1 Tax=Austropuccinia psidii MF-1 TaxID=1389203 RepID=A0A9Q3HBL7_9BASI|nr:hypothetical protein [Austropuccinia psidii MF-1]
MEDSITSTSSQRLVSTFDNLIKSPEADITAIPVFRPKSFPAGNNINILVSIQELVYGGKEAGVGTSSKSLDRHNELISSSEEAHGPRKYRGSSEGLDTYFLQRTSPTDKSLVKTQSILSEDQKRKLAQKRTTAQWKLTKPQQVPNKGKKAPKNNKKGKKKAKGKEKPKWKKTYPQNY